jgi:hypothetical protein
MQCSGPLQQKRQLAHVEACQQRSTRVTTANGHHCRGAVVQLLARMALPAVSLDYGRRLGGQLPVASPVEVRGPVVITNHFRPLPCMP